VRTCIFCGATADSREHIFADWINELIAATEFDALTVDIEDGQIARSRSYPTKQAAGQRAKIVCEACNHGWMSKLEGEAKPVLSPLILGHASTLDMVQQILAATWAVKTAMVGETIQYSRNAFSQDDRDIMLQEQRPPLRAHVAVAAYALDAPNATRYMRGLGEVRRDGTPLTDLYTHTIQVAHLVLSIRGVTTLPASDNRSLESIAEPRHYEIPVFPPAEVCRWPPGFVMDEKALIEYSGGNNLRPGAG
jgi:hypothetical protein